ncbi:malonyl CoA-acyl carrier protein transacylase, partial [bacterium LRH843]|nr:malonyl CoA-acyl carrier protein transacylase [bacterium LRH843]
FNGPGQTVIAGTAPGVGAASQAIKKIGARKVVPLKVSAPFHCALMNPAKKKMAAYLQKVQIRNANIPIIANVRANAITNKDDIRESLV